MKLNTMKDLEEVVGIAIKKNEPLGLLIEMPGFELPELITNPVVNLKKKLDYYRKTYDENLEHKYSKGIKIIGYTFS